MCLAFFVHTLIWIVQSICESPDTYGPAKGVRLQPTGKHAKFKGCCGRKELHSQVVGANGENAWPS